MSTRSPGSGAASQPNNEKGPLHSLRPFFLALAGSGRADWLDAISSARHPLRDAGGRYGDVPG